MEDIKIVAIFDQILKVYQNIDISHMFFYHLP